MPRESWSFGTVLGALLILALVFYVLSVLKRAFKGSALGQRQSGLFVTAYEWEHALLYIDGRFSQILPRGGTSTSVGAGAMSSRSVAMA
jgi:hypothetical protein